MCVQLTNVQHVQASDCVFAAILGDVWSDAFFGGDSSDVQEQLKNVQQIQASPGALAAILSDAFVVTWAHAG